MTIGRKNIIPAIRIREIFDFDPDTGVLTRKQFCNHGPKGERGTMNLYGYRYFSIHGEKYLGHKIAWACHYGEWPKGRVTFINGDKTDHRIKNLVVWDMLLKARYDHTSKEGTSAWRKADRIANPGRTKHQQLKRKFGISINEYNDMVAAQNNCCAICEKHETAVYKGKIKALAVDHDHESGKIRGLLCQACNILIGYSNENEDTLIAAIKYLQKHNGTRKTFVPVLVKNESSSK